MAATRTTLLLTVSVLVVLASSARAVTFGADLANLPANNSATATCAQAPPGLDFSGPFGSPSCMYSYQGIGATTDTLTPPGGGVVNAVRVKVGTTTGKMRVNVIRFLFRQTGDAAHPFSAGPFLEAYGPEFTPTANSITTVPTNLSLKVDGTPLLSDLQTIQVIDALALEVEASNVPIPLFSTGALTYPVYPGPTAQGLPAPSPNGLPSFSTYGYGVLMNADITLDAGGPAGPTPVTPVTPVTPGALLPVVQLGSPTATVQANIARLPIVCQVVDCSGQLTLLQGATAAATTKKAVSLGSAKFALKAGAKGTVKVKLNARGRTLVKRSKKLKVTARVTFSSAGGKTASYPVTLKR